MSLQNRTSKEENNPE